VFVKVKGNINLGLLGNAVIVGTIDSRNDHASLFAGFNVNILGVQLCGYVETSYEQGSYKVKAFSSVKFGVLGTLELRGEFDSSNGVLLSAEVNTGNIKSTILRCINEIVDSGLEDLFDALKTAIKEVAADALNVFSLDRVKFELDT
jgi:hypothetical protein